VSSLSRAQNEPTQACIQPHPTKCLSCVSATIDLDMDLATAPQGLPHAPLEIVTMVLQTMCLKDRFTCALVCKAWAEAATAATRHRIILKHRVDLSCLQRWLEKYGNQLQVLQLHEYYDGEAALTALPCPHLQDLLLWGSPSIGSRVWSDIAAATKLTSVSLVGAYTAAGQAAVVSALTALPDLQQLTWRHVWCSGDGRLSDSLLLKQATQLTALCLVCVSREALEHLGSLTKLQDLNIRVADEWAAAGCPGLQELKALTRLCLSSRALLELPASISQLTALQQLNAPKATATALNRLQALTGLTQLMVAALTGLLPESPPLQLTGLKHLELRGRDCFMPISYLARCTQLHVLGLDTVSVTGPGSLVASTSLEHLKLCSCRFNAADGAADAILWQQVFQGPGRLPHLTSLQLNGVLPALQQADIERLVVTCSNLQVLHLDTIQASFAPAMAQLSALTSLHLHQCVTDEQCGVLAQLTGLRELRVTGPTEVSVAGLRQLAALEQLTSLGFAHGSGPCNVSPGLKEQLSDRLPGCQYAIINKVCITLTHHSRWHGVV